MVVLMPLERGASVSAGPDTSVPADVACATSVSRAGRTLLIAHLAGVDIDDDLRRELVDRAERRVVDRTRRLVVHRVLEHRRAWLVRRIAQRAARRREDERFYAFTRVWPDRMREVPRTRERGRTRSTTAPRAVTSDDDPPPGLRRLDAARLVREPAPPPVVYACRCWPGEECFGCGTLYRALRAEGGAG